MKIHKVHKLVVHNIVNFAEKCLYLPSNQNVMYKPFVYGTSVSGENFTDRVNETTRIKKNFSSGINTILISPRRLGKTSLVKKVISELDGKDPVIVFMDIYDCRSAHDFYLRYSQSILKALSSTAERLMENAKEFLGRLAPRISINPDLTSEYSLSIGVTPKDIDPEEILNLPERIAEKKGLHIVVCIDEFQQIGEFSDSLTFQKRLRGVWQHQQRTSYCLFGSKKHMMEKIFHSKRMPFYMFGDTIHLGTIPEADWVSYICSRFNKAGVTISKGHAEDICRRVDCYSSYVQQLAWNVMVNADSIVTDIDIENGLEYLLSQNEPLYIAKIENLSSFQLNFLRAICAGVNSGFTSENVLKKWNLGSKSNVSRIRSALIEKELIDKQGGKLYVSDPVLRFWLTRYLQRM